MFSQIAITILGLFVVFMGLIEVNPLTGGPAALIVVLSSNALYRTVRDKRNHEPARQN